MIRRTLIALLAAGACFGQTMFRGDAGHSGVYAAGAPRAFHGVKWRFATGGKVVSSAVAHEGAIYFGSDDGNLYAVASGTGRQLWQFVTGGPVSSTPAVAAGLVYFGSYDGRFYAVDANSGALRWKFAASGERRFEAKGLHGMQPYAQTFPDPYDVYLSSPVIADGAVYFGSGDGNLYAVDATSGALRWAFHTGDVVHASPAYAGGTLFFGSWDSLFYAVDAATGKEKWRANNQGSWVNSSPAVAGGKVYFATSDSSLFRAVDSATGKPVFQQQLKGYVFSSPSIAGDIVYLGVLNGTMEARDRNTGELLWTFQTETSKQNRDWVLTAEGKLNPSMFFRSNWHEGPLVAADREFSIGGIFSAPLIADGVVYIGSADGFLYALQ